MNIPGMNRRELTPFIDKLCAECKSKEEKKQIKMKTYCSVAE
jgi:hypothetical protein